MVEPLRGTLPRVVVEFGPGTGVITRELLDVLAPDGTLLAFEISPTFVTYLRDSIADRRLQVVPAGAETAAEELRRRDIGMVDGVVSSLGIGMMDSAEADGIFRPLLPALGSGGAITQFQYVHRMRMHGGRVEAFDVGEFMGRYFHTVDSSLVLMNVPPAFVITCRDPRDANGTASNGNPARSLGYTRS